MNTDTSKLTKAQLHLLRVFSKIDKQEEFDELKQLLFNFYQEKVNDEADKIWNEKNLSNELLDEFLKTHKRTEY